MCADLEIQAGRVPNAVASRWSLAFPSGAGRRLTTTQGLL